jgi:hypothetical protein
MKQYLYILVAFSLAFGGCGSTDAPKKSEMSLEDLPEPTDGDTAIYENARAIFYSMPSPLELTTLVKSAGGDFRKDLLHDPNRASIYQTSVKRALILGVYGADLSYTTVYRQKNDAIKFLAACKRVGEAIGIHEAFSAGLIERANNNLENRDSMLAVLTDMYWHTNSQLREESRDQIAVLVMAGGWAEGLYIGTSMMTTTELNKEITLRMSEQKYPAEQLSVMFGSFKGDQMVDEAKPLFKAVFDFYAKLNTEEEALNVSANKEGITTIGGKKDIEFGPEKIAELKKLAAELRTKIIEQ